MATQMVVISGQGSGSQTDCYGDTDGDGNRVLYRGIALQRVLDKKSALGNQFQGALLIEEEL